MSRIIKPSRRALIGGLGLAIASPAIVRAQRSLLFRDPLPTSGGAPITVFADSALAGDNAIAASCSVRVGVAVGAASGPLGQVRVTIKAGANSAFGVQGLDCDHLSIGVSTGTLPDTVATPIELKGFDGTTGVGATSGCSLHTAGAQATSDWASLSFLSTATLVIIFDQGAASNFDAAFHVGAPSVGAYAATWHKLTTASYATASTGGTFSPDGTFGYGIVSVETR